MSEFPSCSKMIRAEGVVIASCSPVGGSPLQLPMDAPATEQATVPMANEGAPSIWGIVAACRTKIRRTPPLDLLWSVLMVLFVVVGNVMQVIMLNIWLTKFPVGKVEGNYISFLVGNVLFAIFFTLVLVIFLGVKRPAMHFARHAYGIVLIFAIGASDAINSWMANYAASYTPEVTQALITNLVPLFSVFGSKFMLGDSRSYCNGWIVTVFLLTVLSVGVVSVYNLTHNDMGATRKPSGRGVVSSAWVTIFLLSVPFRVLMNLWQIKYMLIYTHDQSFCEWVSSSTRHAAGALIEAPALPGAGSPASSPTLSLIHSQNSSDSYTSASALLPPREASSHVGSQSAAFVDSMATVNAHGCPTFKVHQGSDFAVKAFMLAGETSVQALLSVVLLPADALPWWGNSDSITEVWSNVVTGLNCVMYCEGNFLSTMLFTFGFIISYIGSAYLNQYSLTTCSIVTQISAPVTALALIMVPSWNVQGEFTPWYLSLVSIIMQVIATVVYTIWEELTEAEKMQCERQLKMKYVGLQPPTEGTVENHLPASPRGAEGELASHSFHPMADAC